MAEVAIRGTFGPISSILDAVFWLMDYEHELCPSCQVVSGFYLAPCRDRKAMLLWLSHVKPMSWANKFLYEIARVSLLLRKESTFDIFEVCHVMFLFFNEFILYTAYWTIYFKGFTLHLRRISRSATRSSARSQTSAATTRSSTSWGTHKVQRP